MKRNLFPCLLASQIVFQGLAHSQLQPRTSRGASGIHLQVTVPTGGSAPSKGYHLGYALNFELLVYFNGKQRKLFNPKKNVALIGKVSPIIIDQSLLLPINICPTSGKG